MKKKYSNDKNIDALSKISKDRHRTNLLKVSEQKLLAFLVQRIPSFISSDMLTLIGFFGSLVTASGFVFAKFFNRYWLLIGILGFAINWFGDSLDGRLAYYRNKPRKWYGFSLDVLADWMTNVVIGLGFAVYMNGNLKLLCLAFVMFYGWSMVIALLRYKIANKYTIDSGILGPTEVRLIISLLLVLEVVVPNSIIFSAIGACTILLVFNIVDSIKLLKMGDERDNEENKEKHILHTNSYEVSGEV